MPELTPKRAALWAKWVYKIKDAGLGTPEVGGSLPDFVRMDRFEGESGIRVVSKVTGGGVAASARTGFVLFARGSKPHNRGEIIVSVRGTVSAQDWLTNFNAASERYDYGPGLVHSGFYGLFNTVKADLERLVTYVQRSGIALMGATPITTIHVVGHSLGGAVANIVAGYLKSSLPHTTVKLYTFGAPRVGDVVYARGLTAQLGAENMQRIHNNLDPVPLVPPWPFVHAPFLDGQGDGYYLTYDGGNAYKAESHFMATGYIPYVTNRTWMDLAVASSGNLSNGYIEQIKTYLRGAESGGGVAGMVAWGASKAIDYIGAAFSDVARTAGLSVTEAMTLPDQIAYVLNGVGSRSLSASSVLSKWVSLLIQFIGLECERQSGSNALARWTTGDVSTPLVYLGNRILAILAAAIPMQGDLSGD